MKRLVVVFVVACAETRPPPPPLASDEPHTSSQGVASTSAPTVNTTQREETLPQLASEPPSAASSDAPHMPPPALAPTTTPTAEPTKREEAALAPVKAPTERDRRAAGPVATCAAEGRRLAYSEGAALFAQAQKGWSRVTVRQRLGPPTSCQGAVWTYVAGTYEGPEITYVLTFSGSVVVGIEHYGVACRHLQ
jgi:hypothetical protein